MERKGVCEYGITKGNTSSSLYTEVSPCRTALISEQVTV